MLGFTGTAFGQLTCSIASAPYSRSTITAHTAPAGDIIFACVPSPDPTLAATFFVTCPVPITNSASYPTVKPISITGIIGFPGGVPAIASVSNGTVTIDVPAQAVPTISVFTLTGVLLSLTGYSSGPLAAALSVSAGTNVLIAAGNNTPTVITSVIPGLKSPTLTPATSVGTLLATGTVLAAPWSIDIQENYIDSFLSSAQYNSGASTNGTRVALTFSGIPTGVTLGSCSVGAVANGTVSPGVPFIDGGLTTVTSISDTVNIDWGGPPNLQQIETLTFGCTSSLSQAMPCFRFLPAALQFKQRLRRRARHSRATDPF